MTMQDQRSAISPDLKTLQVSRRLKPRLPHYASETRRSTR
jgi:hypothetical protein